MKKFLLKVVVLLLMFLPIGVNGYRHCNARDSNDSWLIYWYVCGSDLETNYGAATVDFNEIINADIPDNVRVLIEAGGSVQWQNDLVRNDRLNRFLFDSEGLHELDALPDADMGDPNTLADFLQFGLDNLDADHRVFIFWDHGGGSAFGVCLDERTGNALRLNDIRAAFEHVFEPSHENPPFELVGFDACLMATYDVAHDLHGLTKYMTASEEVEPGNGWAYVDWLNALGQNTAMNGAALGKIICDTYYSGCQDYRTEDMATLSVIDMKQLPALRDAYEAFGLEALQKSVQSPQKFFSAFGRNAKRSENYGGNTREQGYQDMVDLADLADKSKKILPQTSQALIDAVNDAVIYKVNGAYRTNGNGISGFYPYDGGDEYFSEYSQQLAVPLEYKCLYYHQLYGVLPDEAQSLLDGSAQAIEYRAGKPTETVKLFDISDLEDTPVDIDDDGNAFVTLNPQQLDQISSVHCNLVYFDVEDDVILYLGSDSNIVAEWDSGVFKDNFQAVWGMLDGHVVYVELTAEEDGYNIYSVPIKLNGVDCNLQVVYDFKTEKYKVLGARKETAAGSMSDRNLIKIKEGDRITTIVNAMSISGDDEEFAPYEVETFTVGNALTFEDQPLGDGEYGYCFEFVTPDNDNAVSEMINFTVADGQIITSKLD